MRLFCLILFFLLTVESVFGASIFTSGNQLQKWVKSERTIEKALYAGYVSGVSDTANGALFCIPAEVRVEQIMAIVEKFLKNNPEKWNNSGSSIVIDAMETPFPCK